LKLETHEPVLSLLLLVADLAACGDAAPVRLLARMLPRDRFRVTVGVLGTATAAQFDEVRAAGIAVHSLPIRHVFDLNGAHRLRQAVKAIAPAVVHAWGSFAAGVARLVVSHRRDGTNTPRFVVSGAATPGGGLRGWLVARQVRRADRAIPSIRVDGERYRRFGVSSDHLTLIGPAAPTFATEPDRDALCGSLGIPPTSIFLVAGGRSDRGIGPRDAIVAFDMLRYDSPNLHLIVFGTGTEAGALERFGRALAFDDFRVRFAMCVPERAAAVQLASVVLITHPCGGVEEALEAMAAGKPVVGWRTPELAEIVDDGVTGFLVPVGDRTALAARTRKLLDEPDVAVRLGEAGQTRTAERFSINRMIEQYARLYSELVR
jgi:glycosyltransferase involved in cell wall biosynthesis